MIWVFLATTAAILYVLAGWPLLLGFIARRKTRPVRKAAQRVPVSVIIPVQNGQAYIGAKLDTIFGLDYPRELLEVIVISDGSTDQTEAIVRSHPGVRLISVPRGGKCAALNTGIAQATGEILFLTDVRQRIEPASLSHMVDCFADPEVGVVSGELRIEDSTDLGAQDVGLYRRFETWLRNQLSAIDSMFGATGAIYTIRRSLAVPFPPEALLDDMYLPLAAFFRGYRCVVEPNAVAWDVATPVSTEFIRKVRTLAGNYQLLRYYPGLLSPFHNRLWIHYISYKIARLVLPWLLVLLAVSSFFLPEPINWIVLAGQALVYLLALTEPYLPERTVLRKLASPARTFVTMMIAAVVALRVCVGDPKKLWVVTDTRKGNSS